MKDDNRLLEKMALIRTRTRMDPISECGLIQAISSFYLESFPDGYGGYIRDFKEEELKSALVSPAYTKFYYLNGKEEVVGFAMLSDQEKEIISGAERDPVFFRKVLPERKEKLFWVFIFSIKENWRRAIIVPFIAKVLQYIFENGGMAAFSFELQEAFTLVKQIQSAYRIAFGRETESCATSHEVTSVIYLK